ncbi:MAG: leucine-rich repeat domain-containing protein [Candidatus Thorarchaeota archaeon]
MELTPNRIYENFRSRTFNEGETVKLLIDIIENINDDVIKKDCIKILNKLELKNKNVFTSLEYILVSEINEDLRFYVANLLKNKYSKKALSLFLWILKHEYSYNCLITTIKALEEFNDEIVIKTLSDEINRINSDIYEDKKKVLLYDKNYMQNSSKELACILINLITIRNLKRKFNKLKFTTENGFITQLDFSKIDNQVINWHDRDAFEDYSEIIGIENLKNLRSIEFFPIEWVIKNEYNYKSSIALIEALEKLNNKAAKNVFITQVSKIYDQQFKTSIEDFAKQIDKLSLSKLSDIFRNYLTLLLMRKKYPTLNYNIINGEVVSIFIEKAPLIKIPSFIKHFHSLNTLILKNCKIYNIPNSIESLESLKILNLEGNNLKTIPQFLSSLTSLKVLNLSKNEINQIPHEIGSLTSLQFLNLETNKISDLPHSIGRLSSLRFLNLSKNHLREMPSSIGDLKSLKKLDLSFNKIKKVPSSIGLLNSLIFLNLKANNLEKLPNPISSLSRLKILNLEENKLLALPELIGLLKSIETLKLGWNKLQKIPISASRISSLKILHLNNNKFIKFPNSIFSISSLEFLDISSNDIRVLPEEFNKLKSLKTLILADNKFENFSTSLCSLFLLEKLDFSRNCVRYLPKSIELLESLRELWLIGNKLKYLPKSIGSLKNLKKLKIDDNRFVKLPKELMNI